MKNPNARGLAVRDMALAAAIGAIGADFGADVDDEHSDDFGSDYGSDYGTDMGDDDDWGADAPSLPQVMAAAKPPSPQAAMALWRAHHARVATTHRRRSLLNPNAGSDVDVEHYRFPINATITKLGTSQALTLQGQPTAKIRPKRITMNAPAPGFCTVESIQVANVLGTLGDSSDAFEYNANGVGQVMDLPTLSPANKAIVRATHTGFVPPGYTGGSSYLFVASFTGPAQIIK